jgi:hypothetical protein
LGLLRIVFAIRIGIIAPWEAATLTIDRTEEFLERLAVRPLRIQRRLDWLAPCAVLYHGNSPKPVAVSALLAIRMATSLLRFASLSARYASTTSASAFGRRPELPDWPFFHGLIYRFLIDTPQTVHLFS